MTTPQVDYTFKITEVPSYKPIIQRCMESKKEEGFTLPPKQLPSLVHDVEDIWMFELRNKDSEFAKTFLADLQWIANEIKMNVFAFIAHTNECIPYIKTLLKQETGNSLNLFKNKYPTIVLMIACIGAPSVVKYNNDPEVVEKNYYFFAFSRLMHFYKGNILQCEKGHNRVPEFRCPTGLKGSLTYGNISKNGIADYEKIRKLPAEEEKARCCASKFAEFADVFLNDFDIRQCSRFPKETLLAKFLALRENGKGDGALLDRSQIPKEVYQIDIKDGIECSFGDPCFDKTEYAENKKLYFDLEMELKDKYIKPLMYAFEYQKGDDNIAEKVNKINETFFPLLFVEKAGNKKKPIGLIFFVQALKLNYLKTVNVFLGKGIMNIPKTNVLQYITQSELPTAVKLEYYRKLIGKYRKNFIEEKVVKYIEPKDVQLLYFVVLNLHEYPFLDQELATKYYDQDPNKPQDEIYNRFVMNRILLTMYTSDSNFSDEKEISDGAIYSPRAIISAFIYYINAPQPINYTIVEHHKDNLIFRKKEEYGLLDYYFTQYFQHRKDANIKRAKTTLMDLKFFPNRSTSEEEHKKKIANLTNFIEHYDEVKEEKNKILNEYYEIAKGPHEDRVKLRFTRLQVLQFAEDELFKFEHDPKNIKTFLNVKKMIDDYLKTSSSQVIQHRKNEIKRYVINVLKNKTRSNATKKQELLNSFSNIKNLVANARQPLKKGGKRKTRKQVQ